MSRKQQSPSAPAQRLAGMTLESGWVIGEQKENSEKETGGAFSVCYHCKNKNGTRGFLKALDYGRALSSEDPARALEILTTEYNYERDMLEYFRQSSRIVTALDFGAVKMSDSPYETVQYIVFEMAESTVGLSTIYKIDTKFEWRIRTLHQIAVGLHQMHSKNVSHQDIKPSNALLFGNDGAKLCDLGSSVSQDRSVPHDEKIWPGDLQYAPPEVAYQYDSQEFYVRRFATDLYLFGSLLVSVITGKQMTSWIKDEIPSQLHPHLWGGEYTGTYEDVIPVIENAYASAVEKIAEYFQSEYFQSEHNALAHEIIECIRELCQPKPDLRGDPRTRAINKDGNKFNLVRYISKFDRLASQARLHDRIQE